MSRAREKLIQINSHDRADLNSTQSRFTVNLGKDEYVNSVTGVAVKDLQCVNSFYNIDHYNNTWYYDVGGGELSIVIPRGQYNFTAFSVALVAEFLAAGITATVVADSITNLLSFTFSAAISIFRQRSNGELNPIHRVVGIRSGIGGVATPVAVYTAEAVLDLSGVKSVYILSSVLSGGYCTSSRDGGRKMALLDTLPVRVPYGGIIHHDATNFETDSVSYDGVLSNNLSSIDIELRDSENNLLSTNGLDIVIILKIFY